MLSYTAYMDPMGTRMMMVIIFVQETKKNTWPWPDPQGTNGSRGASNGQEHARPGPQLHPYEGCGSWGFNGDWEQMISMRGILQ